MKTTTPSHQPKRGSLFGLPLPLGLDLLLGLGLGSPLPLGLSLWLMLTLALGLRLGCMLTIYNEAGLNHPNEKQEATGEEQKKGSHG